jgi:hypothetical protein
MNNELPPDILQPLLEARFEWSRHGYQICPRSMEEIDVALDALNEYLQAVKQFEETFNV